MMLSELHQSQTQSGDCMPGHAWTGDMLQVPLLSRCWWNSISSLFSSIQSPVYMPEKIFDSQMPKELCPICSRCRIASSLEMFSDPDSAWGHLLDGALLAPSICLGLPSFSAYSLWLFKGVRAPRRIPYMRNWQV